MTFITRSGTQLKNGANTFRFSGCNIFKLGLLSGPVRYPTQFEVNDWLLTAKEMGATVVRSITLGVSVGNSLSIWPQLNTTNTAAFTMIDYAIYKAGLLGLYLVIPLIDNYHLYYGGKHTFTDWESITDETQFYTNSTVISDFEGYISTYLNRTNQYNGLAYKNDPTILAWQLGNELVNPNPGSTWCTTIANYIKSIDSNHLVMDGQGSSNGMNTLTSNLTIANVDIYDDHHYPTVNSKLASDASAVAAQNKVFVVGEYDWTRNLTGPSNGSVALDNTTAAPGGGSQSALVVVSQITNAAFDIELHQSPLSITSGDVYSISFWAKAAVPWQMTCRLQSLTSPTFVIYASQSFHLTTSWQQFSFTNYTATATDTNVQLQFELGNAATTTWIDLVSLIDTTAAPGVNILANPSFENVTLTNWTFNSFTVPSDDLASFLPAVEANAYVSGDLFWSLEVHNDTYGFILHNEVYSLYYPGQTSEQQIRTQALRTHAYKMAGIIPAPPAIVPAAPANLGFSSVGTTNTLTWQGVVGAASYTLELSPTADIPWVAVGSYTDMSPPVTNVSGTIWYRIKAINITGVAGPYAYYNLGVILGQPGAIAASFDTAMLFNGLQGNITLPAGVNTANWPALTVEVWINPSNVTFSQTAFIVANDAPLSTNLGFNLAILKNAVIFRIGTGSGYYEINQPYTFAASTWYHLAGVFAGTSLTVYLNGNQIATTTVASALVAQTTNVVTIGAKPGSTANNFPGTLQHPAIYKKALSAVRIQAHYLGATLGTTYMALVLADGAQAYYRLNETSGTTAFDSTANHFDAQLVGTSLTYSQTGVITADTAIGFGANDQLIMPTALAVGTWGAISLEYWINLTSGYQHIVIAGDSNSSTIYLNGAPYTTGSGPDTVVVGPDVIFSGSFAAGTLSQVSIYKYVLSAAQVANHYQVGSLGI